MRANVWDVTFNKQYERIKTVPSTAPALDISRKSITGKRTVYGVHAATFADAGDKALEFLLKFEDKSA